jgi:hypothetical protein
MLIITLVFEKNANVFAENCRKSQKIVIITSTPGQVIGWQLKNSFAETLVPEGDQEPPVADANVSDPVAAEDGGGDPQAVPELERRKLEDEEIR